MKKTIFLILLSSLMIFQLNAQSQKEIDGIVSKYASLFEWVIKPKYDDILQIPANNILTAKQNGKYGYITMKEEVLVPFQYGYASMVGENGYAFWGKSYGNWNYIIDVNQNGKQVIDRKYNYAGLFHNGYAVVENGLYAIDETGKIVIPFNKGFMYPPDNLSDIIEGKSSDMIPYQKNNNMGSGPFGYINKNAEWIIEAKYLTATPRYGDYYIVAETLKKKGLLDSKGKEILQPEYENIKGVTDLLIQVKKDDKWGLLNKKMELVVPCEYDYICNFDNEGKAYFEKGNKYGYIYADGLKIVENGSLDREAIKHFYGAAINNEFGIFAYEEKLFNSNIGICKIENNKCVLKTDAIYSIISLYSIGEKQYIIVGKDSGLSIYYGLYNGNMEMLIDPAEKEFTLIDMPNSSGYIRIGLKKVFGVAKFK